MRLRGIPLGHFSSFHSSQGGLIRQASFFSECILKQQEGDEKDTGQNGKEIEGCPPGPSLGEYYGGPFSV
jgi:hypothetical protein